MGEKTYCERCERLTHTDRWGHCASCGGVVLHTGNLFADMDYDEDAGESWD